MFPSRHPHRTSLLQLLALGIVLATTLPTGSASADEVPPWAPQQSGLTIVGQRGGVTLGMDRHGRRGLVAGIGPRIQRFELRRSADGSARLVAGERSVVLADVVRDVAVDGDWAWAAAGEAGLVGFQLEGQAARWPAPSLHVPPSEVVSLRVAADGGLVVHVSHREDGGGDGKATVDFLTVSPEGALVPRSSMRVPRIVDLALTSGTLLLETNSGPRLRAFKVADPGNPRVLQVGEELLTRSGSRHEASLDAHAGRLAIGTEQGVFFARRQGDELVVDRRLKLPPDAGMGPLAFDGRRVTATGFSFKTWSLDLEGGAYRQLSRVHKIRGIDVVEIVDDTMVSASQVGLELVDLDVPPPHAVIATPDECTVATGLTIAGGRTIVGSRGERVIEMSTAAFVRAHEGRVDAPSARNLVDTTGWTSIDARSPFVPTAPRVVSDLLWVLGHSEAGVSRLIHVPPAPVPVPALRGPEADGRPREPARELLTSRDSPLAWTFQGNHLRVLDLSSYPATLVWSRFSTSSATQGAPIARDGERGIIAGRDHLWLLEPDPAGGAIPRWRKAAATDPPALGVALQGDLAVVGGDRANRGVLRAYDLSRPAEEQLVGAIDLADITRAMTFAGPKKVVATRKPFARTPSVHLIDMSRPAFPDEIAMAGIAGAPDAIAAHGRLIAVAAGGAGVYWLLDESGLDRHAAYLPWVAGGGAR